MAFQTVDVISFIEEALWLAEEMELEPKRMHGLIMTKVRVLSLDRNTIGDAVECLREWGASGEARGMLEVG